MEWKSQTYTLDRPIKFEDRDISEITLREPTIDMLEAVDDLGLEPGGRIRVKQMRGIISILSGVPSEALGGIHRDDMVKLSEIAAPLLSPEEEG